MDTDRLDVLLDLLRADGPSGHEDPAAATWRRHAAAAGGRVEGDVLGSSYARFGPANGPTVLLLGHIDEIGLIVTHVEDDDTTWPGLLRIAEIGAWDPQTLVGQRLRLRTPDGRTLPGVVGRPPRHLLEDDALHRAVRVRDLWVDIGARDEAEALALAPPGTVAVVEREPVALAGRLTSRALDNRTGAWVVLEAARRAAARGLRVPVVACACALEETLGEGARAAAHRVAPAVTVVVDVTQASDVPDVPLAVTGAQRLGGGPVLSRGLGLHPGLASRLAALAARDGIPTSVEAVGGTTSTYTDVDGAIEAHAGSAIALVSLPLRHMHTPSEVCDLDDLDRAADLIAALCADLDPEDRWER